MKKMNFFQELSEVRFLEFKLDLAIWRVSEWQGIGYLPEVGVSRKQVIKASKELYQALKVINAQLEYGGVLLKLFCKLNGTEKYLKNLTERVTYNLLGVKSKELA